MDFGGIKDFPYKSGIMDNIGENKRVKIPFSEPLSLLPSTAYRLVPYCHSEWSDKKFFFLKIIHKVQINDKTVKIFKIAPQTKKLIRIKMKEG